MGNGCYWYTAKKEKMSLWLFYHIRQYSVCSFLHLCGGAVSIFFGITFVCGSGYAGVKPRNEAPDSAPSHSENFLVTKTLYKNNKPLTNLKTFLNFFSAKYFSFMHNIISSFSRYITPFFMLLAL